MQACVAARNEEDQSEVLLRDVSKLSYTNAEGED
jgi:hypothetical protein